MAREFEHYNRKYAHLAGTALKMVENKGGRVAKEDIREMSKWDQETWPYYTYNHEKVAWAVYHSETAEEWQKWRVALKGLSTREKLYVLAWLKVQFADSTAREILLMSIRINNYLGALIRGGQLNSKLEVVR